MANISERIKMLRSNAGLTQEELGNILGLVKSTISLYESGKSTPNDQIKLKLCEYFKVPLDFLIGISNIADVPGGKFDKNMITDGSCRSAFLDLLAIRNMTIDDVVKVTGLDYSIIDNWFKNEVPSLQQLVLVADCLNTSIDYLMKRSDFYDYPSDEEKELLTYYNQLKKIDQRWILGKMTDFLKNYEEEARSSVAEDEPLLKKASGK